MTRLRWRRSAGRWSQPTIHTLSRGDGPWLAIVQETKGGGWFWYGGGRNTCGDPTDLATAKREAAAHIRSLAGKGGNGP